jgi:8-oxo-dGTP diphosphatase
MRSIRIEMGSRDWCVMRQDDQGDRFVVASALTEPEARLLSVSYEVRAYKQTYWVEPMAGAKPAPAAQP